MTTDPVFSGPIPLDLQPITAASSALQARAMLSGAIQARLQGAADLVRCARALGFPWTPEQHDALLDALSAVAELSRVAAAAVERASQAGLVDPSEPNFSALLPFLE